MKGLIIVIAAINLVGCLHTNKPPQDGFCTALKKFVDQKNCDESKSVILETCFMCGDSIFWKNCQSFDYPPGQAMCSFLLEHARTEFAQDNLKSALRCLSNKEHVPIQNALVILNDVAYHFTDIEGVKNDVIVSVIYQENKEHGLPTLKIETSSICY